MLTFLKKGINKILRPNKVAATVFAAVIVIGILYPSFAHAQFPNPFAAPVMIGSVIVNTLLSAISGILIALSSLVLFIAGTFFDYTIFFSLIKFKQFADLDGINTVWRVSRDMANMFFIFILLYISISTILGTGNVNLKKMVIRVVIVALLLNFSLFFTKVVIDASNILATGFYNEIISEPCGTVGTAPTTAPALTSLPVLKDLPLVSGPFICQLGLTKVWDSKVVLASVRNLGDPLTVLDSASQIMINGIMTSIVFLITGVVFLAGAIMFTTRLITLIFIMALSPLAFVFIAMPDDLFFEKWKKRLIENCIFAPVFMAMLWASLQIIKAMALNPSPNSASLFSLFGGGQVVSGSTEAIINYALIIGFIIGTLVVSKQFGAYGAAGALKMIDSGRKNLQSVIGRNTVGYVANKADKYLEKNGGDGLVGRYVRDYTTGALAKSKFGGSMSYKDQDKALKEMKTDIANKAEERGDKGKLKLAAKNPGNLAAQQEAQRILARMSTKEIDSLGFKDLKPHIGSLNATQLEHVLEKSEKFNEKEREEVREARFSALKTAVTTGAPTAKPAIRALSDKEIELLDTPTLSHPTFISNMSESQVESFMKSSRVTAAQKKIVKDERNRPFKAVAEAAAALPPGATVAAIAAARQAIDTELKKMKPQKVAKLDSEDLVNPHVISQLTPAMLSKMPDEQDAATLQTIGNWIRNNSPRGGPVYEYITRGLGAGLF